MARPSAALFRRAMAMQAPQLGRPVARLDVPATGAAAFLASPPVVAALDAGAAVLATCPSAKDAEDLRRELAGCAHAP